MILSRRKGKYLEIEIPCEWLPATIDSLLRNHWKAPKKLIHSWRMDQGISLNGKKPDWNQPLTVQDKLMLPLFTDANTSVTPAYMDLDVLYEDDHLLVVNKPAGVETHPSQPGQSDTLLNAVAFHLMQEGTPCDFTHIHRLDKDTTGALLFAKHPFAGAILHRMLEERLIKRTYKALVHGKLKNKQGTITGKIGKDRHHSSRRRVSQTGQHAVTHYRVLRYFASENLSLIECRLETGKTHQIRVHLSHLGHPLAGDTLYGGKPIFNRQALHAYRIEFTHPITEEKIDIHAPFLDEPPLFPEGC